MKNQRIISNAFNFVTNKNSFVSIPFEAEQWTRVECYEIKQKAAQWLQIALIEFLAQWLQQPQLSSYFGLKVKATNETTQFLFSLWRATKVTAECILMDKSY